MLQLCRVFLCFILYCVVGWVYESILCSITSRSLVNRGFLNGPVCPIYGFGALLVIVILQNQADNVAALFLSSVFLTGVLEYFTSWAMEKFLHLKLWDYSKWPFNINGRVCLYGALVFGVLAVAVVRVVHPVVGGLVNQLSSAAVYLWSAVIAILLSADLFITVRHVLTLNGRLAEIQAAIDAYKAENERKYQVRMEEWQSRLEGVFGLSELRELLAARTDQFQLKLEERFENSPFHSSRIKELLDLKRFQDRRLMKAFPKWNSTSYREAMEELRRWLNPEKSDGKSKKSQEDDTPPAGGAAKD